jgi:DNA polymerase III delta prime subunit
MDMLSNAKKFAEKNPEAGAVRMLFYGLSGTGKTEFARYISESLGKELLLKRASDIFDKYVGGTEQNIAAAFEEAARNDPLDWRVRVRRHHNPGRRHWTWLPVRPGKAPNLAHNESSPTRWSVVPPEWENPSERSFFILPIFSSLQRL